MVKLHARKPAEKILKNYVNQAILLLKQVIRILESELLKQVESEKAYIERAD